HQTDDDVHRHRSLPDLLLVAEGDAAPAQVVRAELYANTIADQDADVELAHLAAGVREHLLAGLQSHLEHRVGQRLDHGRIHLDRLFLGAGGAVGHRRTPCGGAPPGAAGPGWTTCQEVLRGLTGFGLAIERNTRSRDS